MNQGSDAVFVGQLPLPVHLQAGRLEDLIGSCAVPSSSGTRLFIYQDSSAAAVTDATVVAESASSSSNSSRATQLASVVWGLPAVGDTEHGSPPASSGVSSSRGLLQCKTRMKALHTLLQLGRIQLKVAGVVSSTDSSWQQQQEACEGEHVEQAAAAGPAAAATPPAAAPSSSKKAKGKRGSSAATAQQEQPSAATCAGWVWIAVKLLPDFFYTPASAVAAGGSSGNSSARAASCDPTGWTMVASDSVANSGNITADQLIKAVNSLMTILQDLTLLHQHRRQQHRQHERQLNPDVDSDDEYQHIIDQQQHCFQQQQQQQHSIDAPNNAPEALLASEQYDAQFDLYSSPEAAAAAGSDIRQSLFDWVDSSPWKCEREDPPGLANTLYRYQRRALAWMVWREQHGTQPLGFTSNSGSRCCSQESLCDSGQPAQLDPATVAAQGLLGAQLLNPLWTEVKVTTLQPPTPPPPAAVGCSRCSCSPQLQESCCIIPAADCRGCLQKTDQPACIVLWQCVSHGLVSRVCPGGYCGPAGGVLADEMGLGKTVEVLALLLARPPPADIIGTQGVMPAAAQGDGTCCDMSHSDGDSGSDDGDDDYVWTSTVRLPTARKRSHQRQRCQQQHQHEPAQDINSCDSEIYLSSKRRKVAPADGGVTGGPGSGVTAGPAWPAPGKWAGPTLVVTPPAILQQWVSEAKRHAPGLSVHIYDGLKWQRAQAEAEQRKQQGRLSKGARQQQALLEQYNYIINGPPDQPAFDAAADAATAVQQLLTADVILTTFDVLQQEVHFSGGNSDRLSSLRHKKRYVVPESPLLQVSWWRIVLDEAQLVGGGFSSTAVMAARLTAQHRWAVTGTPIGTGGLEDVANLLRLIGATPFDSAYTFKKAIQEPFAASVAAAAALERQQQQQQQLDAEAAFCADPNSPDSGEQQQKKNGAVGPMYGRVERDGVRRLLALLQPLMWRSNKEAAAADHPLPSRHVQCALLRFSPAEQSFYNHIVEKTAEANKDLQQQQQEQQQEQQQQQQQQEAYTIDGPTQQQHQQQGRRGPGRRGRAAAASGALEKQIQQVAAGGILQLRLACIHPQLTSYWRELSSELQLRQGGALSIAEILGRMRDGAQLKLQAAERELCMTLNVLADKVAAQADEAAAAAAAGSSPKQQQLPKAKRKRGSSKKGRPAAAAAESDSDGCDSQDESYEPAAAAAAGSSQQANSTKRSKKRVRFDAAAAAGDGSDKESPGAAGAGSSRRRSSGGGSPEDGQSVNELRQTAFKLLEDSYKVGEYGIAALTSASAAPEPLVDIAGGDATWRAWKHVGLHTAQSLSTICEQLHMSIKSVMYAADVARNRSELLETVDADVARAADKYEKQRGRLRELVVELTGHWDKAAAAGVPLTHMTGYATSAAWMSDLTGRITAAKAAEQQSRQQVVDGQGATITTVLLGQHVPKLLESVEAAAAADKTLLEGIVGQVHARKVNSLLTTLLRQLSSGTPGDIARNVRFASGTAGDAAAAAAAAAKRSSSRSAAGLGTRIGHEDDDDYHPESDHELVSEDDDLDQELHRHVRSTAAAAGSSNGRVATAAVAGTVSAGAAAWSLGIGPHYSHQLKQQQQQQQVHRSCMQMAAAAAAAGSDAESTALSAAHAAMYQFLDCLPERRVLWRLLFRGTLAPNPAAAAAAGVPPTAAAVAPNSGSSNSGVIVSTPDSVAAALGGLLQVYAGTAYGGNPNMTTGSSSSQSFQHGAQSHNAQDPGMQDTRSAQQPLVDEYRSRLCITQAVSLMRQMIRRLEKRETGFIRAVNSAAAAAPGGDNLAAASKLAAAYLQQQRQATDLDSTAAAAVDPDHAIQISDVNIPLLLQQLPVSAVAAAGEAARVRVEVCRQQRDVYVAELGLELAQHNRHLIEEEADAAASGQMSQVLSLSEKSVTDLHKSVSELTKKCDELLRHKRFLANQAADSTHFGKASKQRQDKSSAVAVEGQATAAGAAGDGTSGAGGVVDVDDDSGDDLECAVCRSTMSDELQVFPCGHYFCDGCAAVQLSQPSPSCPYCRARLTKAGVFRVSLAGSGAHEAEVDPPEGREVTDFKVTGTWMTKLEAVLRRVLHMRSVDPTAKALLFSQFPDALVLASKALDVLKIKHVSLGLGGGKDRRMATRTAVKQFNEDSEVCIFLLSLRAGSAGLTLTVANRVFLLEPALDPAIEQQAVARVHRIGQEREVIITRLLVQGTIEEQVLQISENKQALLTEAAHHHHHQQHQSKGQQHQQHDQAAAAEDPDLSDQDDLQQLAAVAAAAGGGDGGGLVSSPRKRRRSRSLGVPDHGGDMDGTAANQISSSAPTTLQSLAPKKEQLGREDVAGLLAAVMKQAIGQ